MLAQRPVPGLEHEGGVAPPRGENPRIGGRRVHGEAVSKLEPEGSPEIRRPAREGHVIGDQQEPSTLPHPTHQGLDLPVAEGRGRGQAPLAHVPVREGVRDQEHVAGRRQGIGERSLPRPDTEAVASQHLTEGPINTSPPPCA
jgi:hypothetical protein